MKKLKYLLFFSIVCFFGCPLETAALLSAGDCIILETINADRYRNKTVSFNENVTMNFSGTIDKEKYESAKIIFKFAMRNENGVYEKRTTKFESDDFDSINNNECIIKIPLEEFDNVNKTVTIKLTAKGNYEIYYKVIANAINKKDYPAVLQNYCSFIVQ